MNKIAQDVFENGFAGPLDSGIRPGLLASAAEKIDRMLEARDAHPIYGRFSVRDWHLIDPEVLNLFTDARIVDAVSDVLGNDILLWRSKIFAKAPGEEALGWHQEWGPFNGEEIGNDKPALYPAEHRRDAPWNLTMWLALDDVTWDMGPIRFALGTQKRRFPIAMEPIVQSEFYLDPFRDISTLDQLVTRARQSALVLDIDTSAYFDGAPTNLTLEEAKALVLDKLRVERGAVTLDFDEREHEIVSVPMKAGQFALFTERCMHGSSANISDCRRLAINARYTFADTLIYPFRQSDEPFDGSNLDVSSHRCVLVRGRSLDPRNAVATPEELRGEQAFV
ncbi:phytanoyl-CoA dioxygenase family protein [Sphingomonas molluscorum]|uniref:phytanoyl-CoA dioxygenase family protein n=1 Tax=Sphingomonas molluscorum TaxID=418184 RepID=UPI0031E0A8D1